MSETVWVAIITAASTLAGGSIASLVAAWNTRKQLQANHALASIQDIERKKSERLSLQRDACMQFISQLTATERAMISFWQAVAPAEGSNIRTHEPFVAASAELNALVDRARLIALEGPEELHIAALQCAVDEAKALAALGDVAHESRGRSDDLGTLYSDVRNTQNTTRYTNTSAFIRAARAALQPEAATPSP
ncbi:hypothetical protein [Streptomyces sp. NRRL S-244]|uniref:hypothetical protein n=1 Tax=Streptomyces sp. NRRL S-244 TaxID=1463897 RepID=UPI00131A5C36|nr:hypothetical protein [Streptomyces sp. NRRL S-244]